MATVARIEGWPFGSSAARLHWIGPVVSDPNHQNPMLLVEFVPYRGHKRNHHDLTNPRNYSWHKSWITKLPVGYLPKLVIGSIWVGGTSEEYPEYETLTIDVNVRFLKSWLMGPRDRTPRGHAIIPSGKYPISSKVGNSAVFVMPTSGAVRALVVPCIEILGCYYAPSSKLAEALTDGTWRTEPSRLLSDTSHFDKATLEGKVFLGKYADDDDVVEISRMFVSDIARAEAAAILPRASVMKNGTQQYPIIIRPPFEGTTQLTVRGLKYKISGYDAFLVFRVDGCTAPMPWNYMGFNRTNPGKQGRKDSLFRRPTAWAGSYRKNTSSKYGKSLPIVPGAAPSAKDVAIRVPGSREQSRYLTDLNIVFEPRGPVEQTGASVYTAEDLAGQQFAVGRGAAGSRYRAAAFVSGEAREIPSKIAAFRSAVKLLESVDSEIILLDEDTYDFAKPRTPEYEGARPWAYMDHSMRQEPRRAAVARVRWRDHPFVLIDVESRPRKRKSKAGPEAMNQDDELPAIAVLRSPLDRVTSDDELRSILDTLISVRGIISGDAFARTRFSSWRHATLKHIADEPAGRYARRMSERIRGSNQF